MPLQSPEPRCVRRLDSTTPPLTFEIRGKTIRDEQCLITTDDGLRLPTSGITVTVMEDGAN